MNDARPTILLVEDRPDVVELVVRTLEEQDHRVLVAPDAASAVASALEHDPALVVLDLVLPDGDGIDVVRTLRARGFAAPVLVLTGRAGVGDRIAGLDAGADDYLAKPFELDELLARVRALLRRAALRADGAVVRIGDVALDPISRRVTRGDEPIPLTVKEFGLLEHLMRHAGRPVSRESIVQAVWRTEFDPSTNIVDVYVTYLRRKLDREGEESRIRTVRGVGYEFRLDTP
mgnify:CR=1 FL=1